MKLHYVARKRVFYETVYKRESSASLESLNAKGLKTTLPAIAKKAIVVSEAYKKLKYDIL